MRPLNAIAPVFLLLIAGCASTDGNSGDAELQRLTADCTARGGIIEATGRQTGRPQLDNTCRVIGSSRLPAD